jgi:hypothetical protein
MGLLVLLRSQLYIIFTRETYYYILEPLRSLLAAFK